MLSKPPLVVQVRVNDGKEAKKRNAAKQDMNKFIEISVYTISIKFSLLEKKQIETKKQMEFL